MVDDASTWVRPWEGALGSDPPASACRRVNPISSFQSAGREFPASPSRTVQEIVMADGRNFTDGMAGIVVETMRGNRVRKKS
jgi:hypothetical protein